MGFLFVSQMAILYFPVLRVATGAYTKEAVIRSLPFAPILSGLH